MVINGNSLIQKSRLKKKKIICEVSGLCGFRRIHNLIDNELYEDR